MKEAARAAQGGAHLQALWPAILLAPVVQGFVAAFWISVALAVLLVLSSAGVRLVGKRVGERARTAFTRALVLAGISVTQFLPGAWAPPMGQASVLLLPAALWLEGSASSELVVFRRPRPRPGLAWLARRLAHWGWLVIYLFALAFSSEILASSGFVRAGLAAKFFALACGFALVRAFAEKR